MFDPKTNKFPYPEQTDQHYLKLKKDRKIIFDSDYPFVDNRFFFRMGSFFLRILLITVVLPVVRIRMGLKVEGRRNLKKHKEVIKNGVISCCNHVHMWDYLGIMSGISPIKPNVLIWAPNINGEWGTMMRHVGGIPIPEEGTKATLTYLRAVKGLLKAGKWLHIYAEGSMWEYYRPIRPFKKGVAFLACECDKPVIPLAYTYREPGFIRKHIFKQIACYTLHIGEPVYKDETLKPKEQRADLTKRVHEAVCALAGIKPEENIYPPIFDNNKRVDYYTHTYGVGYKGSH
ncbi:MAG: 1-acyl-sn-glycerol-3-phosphate acyltransferase [Ruminococcus sp.]|nr:1-acyl-sn-glycerol-3-phosphate acyltransferase [Ruminococcus sp.]